MNTPSLLARPSEQPNNTVRRLRRRGLLAAAVTAAALAGTVLMLAAPGIASASVSQTSSQYEELGPFAYTGDQASHVTAVYTIQNVAEPGTEMLEDHGNSMTQGTGIDVWQQVSQGNYQDPMGTGPYGPITQANYLWEFVPADPADGPSITDGYGELINRQSGLCLDVAGDNEADGATVDQWTCNGQINQQWSAWPNSSGNYVITSYLDAYGGNLGVGSGSTCSPNGNGDAADMRTQDLGTTCSQWDIQQASYDFATYPISVGIFWESDGRGYECITGDTVRNNANWNNAGNSGPMNGDYEAIWDIANLGGSGVEVSAGGNTDLKPPQSTVPNNAIQYQLEPGNTQTSTGQVMLYCDPPTTTP